MAFVPVALIRKMRILKKLYYAKAFSKETAKSLNEIGFIKEDAFPKITERLIKQGIISKTEDGKYYINVQGE